jgi:hypothetical protein
MQFTVKVNSLGGNLVKGDKVYGQIIFMEHPNRGQSSSPSASDCYVAFFAGGYWHTASLSSFEI